ncbi:Disease resistance protein RPM1 [Linum grandiflorum]
MAGLPVDCLAQKLDSLLQTESTLFEEAREQIEEIKCELAAMRSFLEDSDDPKLTHSKSKQTQLARVRDLVYDAEDIVDEFIHHRSKWASSSSSFSGYVRTALERRQIAIKLREINSLIKSIPERNQRYHQLDRVQGRNGVVKPFNSESALFLKGEDLVGIEESRVLITRWLTAEVGSGKSKTISVVGMGGSGKTTLAANVFNSPSVKRCFDCVAWVTVSQSFVLEDLLRCLIKEFGKTDDHEIELSRMGYRELVEKLVEYLEHSSYLIVLDDVWNVNVWSEIKVLLPVGSSRSSRVMITTRMEDIALYCCSSQEGSHIHHVKPLEKKEAMELFTSRAFGNNKLLIKSCPTQILDLAADIVEKCQGLPLAIVSLGGLLSTKGCSVAEWSTVCGNLRWELSNNQMLQPIKSILLLSYYDLSYRLRCCFLYCCLFPEDSRIWCGRLIRLWIAEGFVEDDQAAPEEVAERYVTELIGRNMLQVVDSELATHDRMCKMHDMYREVGLTIASQDKFFLEYDIGKSADLLDRHQHQHRLSVHQVSRANQGEAIKVIEGMSRIRSLFIVHRDGRRYGFSLRELDCRQFKYLRVLDLEEAPVEELPDNIDILFNLRFLNLFATRVKTLPNSIGKLQNLQTLDLVGTKVETLPKGVMELHKLRHLSAGYSRRSKFEPDGIKLARGGSDISKLKNLQSLRLVEASGHLVKQLRLMTQLVVLGITNIKGKAQMDDLCTSLNNMTLLQRLTITTGNEKEILHLDALILPRLQYLTLFGKLKKFPLWICSLPSLIDLQMHWSCLPVEEEPLRHLKRLPSLSSIYLNNACQGTQLVFPRGFDNLKTLALNDFGGLESIEIAQGAMPALKILQVSSCMNLKTVPQGIHHLTELEQFRLEIVAVKLVERIRGPDRCCVRHIPLVQCCYYSSTGRYIQENLF